MGPHLPRGRPRQGLAQAAMGLVGASPRGWKTFPSLSRLLYLSRSIKQAIFKKKRKKKKEKETTAGRSAGVVPRRPVLLPGLHTPLPSAIVLLSTPRTSTTGPREGHTGAAEAPPPVRKPSAPRPRSSLDSAGPTVQWVKPHQHKSTGSSPGCSFSPSSLLTCRGPHILVGNPDGVPSSCIRPGPALATAALWGVNQQMEALSLLSPRPLPQITLPFK